MYVHVPSSWIALSLFFIHSFLTILNFFLKLKNALIIYKKHSSDWFDILFNIYSYRITGTYLGNFLGMGCKTNFNACIIIIYIFLLIFLISLLRIKIFHLKICAIISVFGFVNLFIVKYSVDFWSTLHQPASIKVLVKLLYISL